MYATVRAFARELARTNGVGDAEVSLQILKIQEEAGEVAAAWIGVCGQNPRKGVTHTREQVAEELGDVVVTALVAMATLGEDPADFMPTVERKLAAYIRLISNREG